MIASICCSTGVAQFERHSKCAKPLFETCIIWSWWTCDNPMGKAHTFVNQATTWLVSFASIRVEEVRLGELFLGWFQGHTYKLSSFSGSLGWMGSYCVYGIIWVVDSQKPSKLVIGLWNHWFRVHWFLPCHISYG